MVKQESYLSILELYPNVEFAIQGFPTSGLVIWALGLVQLIKAFLRGVKIGSLQACERGRSANSINTWAPISDLCGRCGHELCLPIAGRKTSS